jgi:autotransporter strand-loop-strand O-heptosyltransferase
MAIIHHSEFFIGLGSGVSWLAWALGKQVVMINNFAADDHEFECIRITNKNVCNGCWNNPNFKFDASDWNFCPIWKGTPRQFECQKSISSNDVIEKINQTILCQ